MTLKRGYFKDINGDTLFDFPIIEDKIHIVNIMRGMIFEFNNAIEDSESRDVIITHDTSLAMRNLMAITLRYIENEGKTDAA